jgi:NAD(P)-dependent dehydrogenase (short-subunit alcohol dehydrogenase family)
MNYSRGAVIVGKERSLDGVAGVVVVPGGGVVGLMRALVLELAPDMIRVNSVHPPQVNTDMIQNPATYELFAPDLPEAEGTRVLLPRFRETNLLVPWVEPTDISNAVPWLASDESRYVTGVTLPVDGGVLVK